MMLYVCIYHMHNMHSYYLQGTKVLEAWFRIDSRPFKQALLTTVKKWSFMFKQHLTDHVNDRYE